MDMVKMQQTIITTTHEEFLEKNKSLESEKIDLTKQVNRINTN
jgi:hypothetical protein